MLYRMRTALQEEEKYCADLLRLVHEQQESVVDRSAEAMRTLAHQIDAAREMLWAARQRRLTAQQELANNLATEATITSIAPQLPEDVRLDVRNTVERINGHMAKIRKMVRQNHRLIETSMKLNEKLIGQVRRQQSCN
jgi:hypothetical protein